MSEEQAPGKRRSVLRDVLWVAGAIALYAFLSIVVLPRLGFVT